MNQAHSRPSMQPFKLSERHPPPKTRQSATLTRPNLSNRGTGAVRAGYQPKRYGKTQRQPSKRFSTPFPRLPRSRSRLRSNTSIASSRSNRSHRSTERRHEEGEPSPPPRQIVEAFDHIAYVDPEILQSQIADERTTTGLLGGPGGSPRKSAAATIHQNIDSVDDCSKTFSLSEDRKTLTCGTPRSQLRISYAAYGDVPISRGCFHWDLRIDELHGICGIGISGSRSKTTDWYSPKVPGTLIFAYLSDGNTVINDGDASVSQDGVPFHTGDIMTIRLNCEHRIITFLRNGDLIDMAFADIPKCAYRLYIEMSAPNTQISILTSMWCCVPSLRSTNRLKRVERELLLMNNMVDRFKHELRDMSRQNLLRTREQVSSLFEQLQSAQLQISDLQKDFITIQNRVTDCLCPDVSNYYLWDHDDILSWILSLENGRFVRYQSRLKESLADRDLTGRELYELSEDMFRDSYGIDDDSDWIAIKTHVRSLELESKVDSVRRKSHTFGLV